MRHLLAIIAVLALAALQLALADLVPLGGVPNLILVYLCVGAPRWKDGESLAASALCGALLDLFSPLPDGVMVLSVVAALALGRQVPRVVLSTRLTPFLPQARILTATCVFFVAIMLASRAFMLLETGEAHFTGPRALMKLAADGTLNLLAYVPVVWLYKMQDKILARFGIRVSTNDEPI